MFDNIYPQIVPRDIYDIVRSKVNQNKYGKRSIEVVYLLRHKLKCGYCGMPISAETGTSKNGQISIIINVWEENAAAAGKSL